MKVYLRTRGKVAAQAAAYAHVFNGTVLKQYYSEAADRIPGAKQAIMTDYEYAYLQLETDEKIMLARHRPPMPAWGYQIDVVLNYTNVAMFRAAVKRLEAHPSFKAEYGPERHGWGTTITKFYDEWGYAWVLEVKE